MHAGVPLNDADRLPWLERVHAAIAGAMVAGVSLVVACSALKESYRATLARGVPDVVFVYLAAGPDLLRARVAGRSGHFMPESLVDTQLAVLEPPAEAVQVDAALPVAAQIATIRHQLRL